MGGYLFYLNVVQSYCFLFTYTHFSAEILHHEVILDVFIFTLSYI